MGALKRVQPNPGLPPKHMDDTAQTIDLSATKEHEATMATVMMPRLHDAAVEVKFNGYLPSGTRKKRSGIIAASLMFLFISTALVYLGFNIVSQIHADEPVQPAVPRQKKAANPPGSTINRQDAIPAAEMNKMAAESRRKAAASNISPNRSALEDYRYGRLDNAVETLTLSAAAKNNTHETSEAKRILAKINTVMELHTQALIAQNKNQFTAALGFWERLLAADMELVGNRPSFFAVRAEQAVQAFTYAQAKAAYTSKKMKKAGQLCRIMLQIDPRNEVAAALLAKIENNKN